MYEVAGVAVTYGAAAAVSDVNLRIDAGELVVVVGPNGAGKSTLINAMAGLHAVASGRLVVDGQDITREAPHRFCDRGIAIGPEGRRLFVRACASPSAWGKIWGWPAAARSRAACAPSRCAAFARCSRRWPSGWRRRPAR